MLKHSSALPADRKGSRQVAVSDYKFTSVHHQTKRLRELLRRWPPTRDGLYGRFPTGCSQVALRDNAGGAPACSFERRFANQPIPIGDTGAVRSLYLWRGVSLRSVIIDGLRSSTDPVQREPAD